VSRDHISTNRGQDPQWYLVIQRVPWWFEMTQNLCNRWPLSRFYQQYMRWRWAKLDTYPGIRLQITDAQQQQVSAYWESKWARDREGRG
jgi:hypothetical protein